MDLWNLDFFFFFGGWQEGPFAFVTSFLFDEKDNRVVDIIFFNSSQLLTMHQTRRQTLNPAEKQSNNSKRIKKMERKLKPKALSKAVQQSQKHYADMYRA